VGGGGGGGGGDANIIANDGRESYAACALALSVRYMRARRRPATDRAVSCAHDAALSSGCTQGCSTCAGAHQAALKEAGCDARAIAHGCSGNYEACFQVQPGAAPPSTAAPLAGVAPRARGGAVRAQAGRGAPASQAFDGVCGAEARSSPSGCMACAHEPANTAALEAANCTQFVRCSGLSQSDSLAPVGDVSVVTAELPVATSDLPVPPSEFDGTKRN
jgi:hypothetical protein